MTDKLKTSSIRTLQEVNSIRTLKGVSSIQGVSKVFSDFRAGVNWREWVGV